MPSFQEIYNKYNDAQAKGLIQPDESLSTFAQRGFQVTGDPSYRNVAQSSTVGNFFRSRSADLSNLVESGPVDEWTSAAVGRIGDLFGITPESSRAVGKKLPRMAVDFLPMAAAAVAAPFTGGGSLVPLAGLAGTSALSAASAFEGTGRPLDAIIGGAAPYVGGKLSEVGSRAALNFAARSPMMQRLGFTGGTKLTGQALTEGEKAVLGQTMSDATIAGTTASRTMLDRPLDKLLGYVGGEAAANVGFTALDIAQQGTDAVFNRDYLFANLISNVPFAVVDMAQSARTRQIGETEFQTPAPQPVYLTPGEERSVRAAAMFKDMEDPAQIESLKRRYGLDITNIELNAEKLRAAQMERTTGQALVTKDFVSRWNNYLESDPLFNQATNGAFRITQGGAFGKEIVGLDKVLEAKNLPARAQELVDGFKDQRAVVKRKYSNVVSSMVKPVSMEESLTRSVQELGLDEFLAKPVAERDYHTALKDSLLSTEGIDLVRDIHRTEAKLKPLNESLWQEFEDFYLGNRADLDFDRRVDLAVAVSLARGNRAKVEEARAKAKEAKQEGQKDPVVVEEFVGKLEEDARDFVQNNPKIQQDAKLAQAVKVEEDLKMEEAKVEQAKAEVRRLDITPEELATARVNLDSQLRAFVAKAEEAKLLREQAAQVVQEPVAPVEPVLSPGMKILEERMAKMSSAGKAKWTPEVLKAAEEFFLTGDTKLVDGLPEQSVRNALRSIFMDVTPGGEKLLAKGDKVLEESVKLAKANAARLRAAKLEKKEVDPELAKLLKEYELASSDKDVVYLIPVPEGDFETVRPFAEKLMAKLVSAGEVKERSAELIELAKFFNNPEVVYARLKGVVEGQGDVQFARASADSESVFAPEAFKGIEGFKSRSKIVTMNIEDFLKLAEPLTASTRVGTAAKLLKEGTKWNSIPALQTRGEKVFSHEGRNRAEALLAAGYKTVPVEIRDWMLRWDSYKKEELPQRLVAEGKQEFAIQHPVVKELEDFQLASVQSKIFGAASYNQKKIFINSEAFNSLNPAEKLGFIFAHEHAHISFAKALDGSYGPEARALAETAQRWVMTADPQAKQVVRDVLMDLHLPKELRNADGIREVLNNDDPNEWLANAMALYAGGAIKASKPKMAFAMLPKPVRNFFEWAIQGMQNLYKGAKTWMKLGGDKEKLAQVSTIKDLMDTIRRSYRQAEWDASEAEAFLRVQPEDMVEKATDLQFAKVSPSARTGGAVFKEEPVKWLKGVFDAWNNPLHTLARLHKSFVEPVLSVHQKHDRITNGIMEVEKTFFGGLSASGKVQIDSKAHERVFGSLPLKTLLNDIQRFAVQENKRVIQEGATPNTLEVNLGNLSPELRGKFAQFKPEAQQALVQVLASFEMANRKSQEIFKTGFLRESTARLAQMMQFKSSFNKADFGKAPEIAKGIMDDLLNGDPVLARSKLDMMDSMEADKLIESAQLLAQQHVKLAEYYAKHPSYMSFRRFKKHKQRMEKPGVADDVVDADTPGELQKVVAEQVAKGWKPKGDPMVQDKKSKEQYRMNDELLQLIRQHDSEMLENMKTQGLSAEQFDSLASMLNTEDLVARQINAKELYKPMGIRKFSGDLERFDALEQFMRYTPAAIHAVESRATEAEVNFWMQNPELKDLQTEKDQFKALYEQSKTPDPEWARKLAKANAVWHIGWNLPGHIAETAQPFLTHLPELIARGDGTVKGLARIMRAEKEMLNVQRVRTKGVFAKDKIAKFEHAGEKFEGVPAAWLQANGTKGDNLEIARALEALSNRIQRAPMSEILNSFDSKAHTQLERLSRGEPLAKLGEIVAKPFNMYAKGAMTFYSQFPMHNAVVAIVSSYRQAREQGFSPKDAIAKAELFDLSVNNSSGRLERPEMFNKLGGAGHLVYQLSSYVRGRFADLATFYRHGWSDDQYGLTPAEKKNARKAFQTMVLAQVGAAGLLGMPFVGAGIALMEELLGEDIKGRMYEALDEVTEDPSLTRALTHGFASAFAESLGIPADMHSRFALGGFLGTNAYDGMSAKSFMGPSVAMLDSLWKLGGAMAQGKSVEEALTVAGPGGVKRLAEALSEDFQRDNPEASLAWSALGFRSSQMTKQKEFGRIVDRREMESRRELELAANRISDQLANPASARKLLFNEAVKMVPSGLNPLQRNQQLQQNIKDLSAKVVALEANKVAPEDIRTQVAGRVAPQVANVGRSMGVQLNDPMELARSLAIQKTRSTLGQPLSQRPVRNAMMRDLQWGNNPWEF
jgi:hypothetical protein